MERRSPFAAAGMVLGAVACIVMLAMLAARGGGGDSNETPEGSKSSRLTPPTTDSPVADAERVIVDTVHASAQAYLYRGLSVIAGQENTVTFPAP